MGESVYQSYVTTRRFISLPVCPRCGKPHENLPLTPFRTPLLERFTYWATCPNTGDPVVSEGKNAPQAALDFWREHPGETWSVAVPSNPEPTKEKE